MELADAAALGVAGIEELLVNYSFPSEQRVRKTLNTNPAHRPPP